jgi:hypothetical protein
MVTENALWLSSITHEATTSTVQFIRKMAIDNISSACRLGAGWRLLVTLSFVLSNGLACPQNSISCCNSVENLCDVSVSDILFGMVRYNSLE